MSVSWSICWWLLMCLQGHLHYWLIYPRWRCQGPSYPDKEPHQVRSNSLHALRRSNHRTSIIFCEVVAIYGVVRAP